MIIEQRAFARAGLLGNPSDGYFGKTISISVRNFSAHVSLYESPELQIEPQIEDTNTYRNIYHLMESVQLTGYYGGTRLLKAAIKTFFEYCTNQGFKFSHKNFTIRYRSSIPRQVGLAGSSAIITATMRALMRFYEIDIPLDILPNVVLSAEMDELGINAGLQDRVIQAYEGCVYMNFDKSIMDQKGHGDYERLDPSLLPKLFIAYRTDLSKVSGKVLNTVRARWEKNDPEVIGALDRIAQIAEEGREAILQKEYDTLHKLMDENFDCRSRIMPISEHNWDLVNTARKCGASAKFTGSGGSIIGIYMDDAMLNRLAIELKKVNARVIKPYIM
ncbi:GHMP kinase [candidate division KSB1 bacterium]|nr:GHMP kinase [candidate division KSB1 bacterium]